MRDLDAEFCNCSCHNPNPGQRIIHMIACCITCPYCKANVNPLKYDEHTVVCKQREIDNKNAPTTDQKPEVED